MAEFQENLLLKDVSDEDARILLGFMGKNLKRLMYGLKSYGLLTQQTIGRI